MFKFVLLLCFVVLYLTPCQAEVNYGFAVLEALFNSTKESFCVAYVPSEVVLANSAEKASFSSFLDLTPWNGCDIAVLPKGWEKIPNQTVAISGLNCTLLQKRLIIQSLGGVGVLIISPISQKFLVGNDSKHLDLNIPFGIMHDGNAFQYMQEMKSNAMVKLYVPQNIRYVNFSLVLIGIMATISIIIGATYTTDMRNQIFKYAHCTDQQNDGHEQQFSCFLKQGDTAKVFCCIFTAVLNVIIFIGTILLLYYFFDSMVYVFIAFYCLASALSVYWLLLPLVHFFPYGNHKIPFQLPKLCMFFMEIREIAFLLCTFALTISWGIFRHKEFMWILQDLLGMAICIAFLSKQRVPSLKICTFILVAFLIYDVFLVYITPLFTPDGKSVMERIVIGESKQQSNIDEQMPTIFKAPYYSSNPIRVCFDGAYFILGFGDVIIPGLLVSFCHDFGFKTSLWNIYFPVVVVGYAFGLIVTDVVLTIMKTGQPALFFLVPCTLFPILMLGCIRKEFLSLWNGQPTNHSQMYSSVSQTENLEQLEDDTL